LPSVDGRMGGLLSQAQGADMADAMKILFDGFVVGFAYVVEDVAGLTGPGAPHGDLSIDERHSGQEPLASVSYNQLQVFSLEPPVVYRSFRKASQW
jgi:hypothetical protein